MFIVAGNWKLNKTPAESSSFLRELAPALAGVVSADRKVIVFPPALCLQSVAETLGQVKDAGIEFGAQNVYCEMSGAFTGENSVQSVKELGAGWILIGHSERRSVFHEDDELLAKKSDLVLREGMKLMFCVGETLQEREEGRTTDVLRSQLSALAKLSLTNENTVIAYEPVWAIGTGKVASLEQVDQAHGDIRSILSETHGDYGASATILYGGSVKPGNAADLSKCPNVNGFLVGGASLKVDDFNQIARV